MPRDLDIEDRVRVLKGQQEWANMLAASEPFQWFIGLLEHEVEKTRLDLEDETNEPTIHRLAGRLKGLRIAINTIEYERLNLTHELQAQGVV